MAYAPIMNAFRLTGEEAGGQPDYMNALMKGLQGAQTSAETVSKPSDLAAKLLAAQLENKINTPKAEDALGWYQAQKNLLGAQAASAGASANKSAMIQRMMQQILGGGSTTGAGTGASSFNQSTADESQGDATYQQPQQDGQQQGYGQPQQGIQGQSNKSGITYPQAALMSKMLGLGDPKIIDLDGRKVAVTPFGNIPVGEGISTFGKQIAKKDAEVASKLEENVMNAMTKESTLDEVADIVGSQEFENMKQHPIAGKFELGAYGKFGTPAQQNMVGQFMAHTGNIIKDASRDFAGQFRKGEQGLLTEMKPSASDTVEVARGKTQALQLMIKLLRQRSQTAARLIRNKRMSPIDALDVADKSVNSKEIKDKIREKLHPKYSITTKVINGKTYKQINGVWHE